MSKAFEYFFENFKTFTRNDSLYFVSTSRSKYTLIYSRLFLDVRKAYKTQCKLSHFKYTEKRKVYYNLVLN